jgi:hypothetical protein
MIATVIMGMGKEAATVRDTNWDGVLVTSSVADQDPALFYPLDPG